MRSIFATHSLRLLLSTLLVGALASGCAADAGSEEGDLGTTAQPIFALSSAIWQTNYVPVCWETGGNETQKGWVRNAVSAWENASKLRFTGWGTCTSASKGIRIGVADVGPHTKGLGNSLDGLKDGMVLNFTYRNWGTSFCVGNEEYCTRVIAVHEFGHALGLAHEQNRNDTPNSCMPCTSNAQCASNSWCKMYPGQSTGHCAQGTDGDTAIGGWDLDSVMNYCSTTWNNGGRLTAADVTGLNQLYVDPSIVIRNADSRSITDLCIRAEFDIAGARHSDYECIGNFTGTTTLGLNAWGGTYKDGAWRGNFLYLQNRAAGDRKIVISLLDSRTISNLTLRVSFKIGTEWHGDWEPLGTPGRTTNLLLSGMGGLPSGYTDLAQGGALFGGWQGNFLRRQ